MYIKDNEQKFKKLFVYIKEVRKYMIVLKNLSACALYQSGSRITVLYGQENHTDKISQDGPANNKYLWNRSHQTIKIRPMKPKQKNKHNSLI